MDVQIRWLIRADMPDVLEIERLCFEFTWTDEDFMYALRQRNCIGMVAEHKGEIVGQMVYELHKNRLALLTLSVAPKHHRKGVGRQMVMRLIDKLSQQRRHEIVTEVREANLDAQLFFQSLGFKAVQVLHGHYDDTDEDGYELCYTLPGEGQQPPQQGGGRSNRPK